MSIDTMLAARESAMRRLMTSSHPSAVDVRTVYGDSPPPGVWASSQLIDPQHPERAEYKMRLEWAARPADNAPASPPAPTASEQRTANASFVDTVAKIRCRKCGRPHAWLQKKADP